MAALASLAFVAAPSASPTITLNLDQPGLVKVLADSFSLGGLDWDGDPETGTGSYATRQVEFTLQFTGAYEEAASAIQAAVRQLTQSAAGFDHRNWLMFRWAGSQPFFLEMFPTSVGALNWRQSGAGVWEMPVSVMCAFGVWGAPEDVASFTITNDPTSGTNKMMVGPSVLGTVKGDLETPLILAQTAASQAGTATEPYLLTSYAVKGFTHSLLARDLTELTSGTDVGATVSAAGTNYINANYKSCSFATATLAERFLGIFSTALTPMPGQYRVLLRVVIPGVAGTNIVNYGFSISFGGSTGIYTDTVTAQLNSSAGTDHAYWVDLGVAQLHANSDYGAIGLGSAASTTQAPSMSILASAAAVTGAIQPLRFDEMLLLPTATTYGTSRIALVNTGNAGATTTNPLVFDSVNDSLKYVYDASTTAPLSGVPAFLNGASPSWVGGMPTLVPGANNYLTIVTRGLVPATTTTTFAGRYYPRYAHVKPSAT